MWVGLVPSFSFLPKQTVGPAKDIAGPNYFVYENRRQAAGQELTPLGKPTLPIIRR
jgi:hypothetical protein